MQGIVERISYRKGTCTDKHQHWLVLLSQGDDQLKKKRNPSVLRRRGAGALATAVPGMSGGWMQYILKVTTCEGPMYNPVTLIQSREYYSANYIATIMKMEIHRHYMSSEASSQTSCIYT